MSLKIPLRNDGMPDLRNHDEFIRINDLEVLCLGDLKQILMSEQCAEGVLLRKAIEKREDELVERLLTVFVDEKLSINDAINILAKSRSAINNKTLILLGL